MAAAAVPTMSAYLRGLFLENSGVMANKDLVVAQDRFDRGARPAARRYRRPMPSPPGSCPGALTE